jgi:RNA methyltransferase, TrmH family
LPKTVSSVVSSADNELVKRLRRLAADRVPGEVLLEGPRVVRQALAAGLRLELLAVREDVAFEAEAERRVTLSAGAARALSGTQTPQGVLAVARAELATPSEVREIALAAGWPLVVLDGIQDPGNVGAIARSAAAAGAPALLVLPGTADPYGAKAIRASAGHVFNLRVARGEWNDLAGLRLVGAAARGRPLAEVDLTGIGALVLGSEAHGLSRGIETVTLPMAPGVESLNVAAAAAILLYELARTISR